MKHQRSREEEEYSSSSGTGRGVPATLSGIDHREKKRPRTDSCASTDSLIENDGSAINTKNYYAGVGTASGSGSAFPTPELTAEETTPRLLALISSLENAADGDLSLPKSSFESLTPSFYSAAAAGAVSPPPFQPLTARPEVHSIVERPLVAEAAGFGAATATTAAAAQRLQQQREMMRLATLVADVTSKIPGGHHKPLPSSLASAPSSFSNGGGGAAALYSSLAFSQQLQQRQAAVSAAAAALTASASQSQLSTRQRTIQSAVNSDYKKIFRPLQRPPRLPTANEARSTARGRSAITVTGQCYR